MTKTTGLGCLGIAALLLGACGGGSAGPAGSMGPAGDAGANGAQGATGAQGPGTSGGEGGTPAASFSLIEPRIGLAGRELDVTVGVEGASLNASSTIDFGDPKVAVSAIQVVSPTTLYAHLTIDPAATLGVHDVTVTDGTTSLKGTGAFTVASEITVTVIAGTAQQGGVFGADVHSNDTANFFDSNSANPAATANLYSFGASGITPNDLTAAFLVPPAGVVGNAQVTVTNASGTAWASAPNALTVAAQTPTALTLPYAQTAATIPASGSVYESATTAVIGILNYTIDVSASSTFLPSADVFPASGQVGDVVAQLAPAQSLFGPVPPPYHLIASIANTAATSMPTSLVLFDQSLSTGASTAYNISVTNTAVSAVTVSKNTAHGTPALAQALTLPGIVTGTITAAGQIDAYKVTIPANAVFEFSISGTGGAYAGVPADQTGLVLNSASEGQGSGADTTAAGGGTIVDTETFTQAAVPTTTTMYFVVAADPNLTALKTGTYTVTTRIVP